MRVRTQNSKNASKTNQLEPINFKSFVYQWLTRVQILYPSQYFSQKLMIPLFHMNFSAVIEQENRTLAKFPQIREKEELNGNYGKEFESWLGDRFWGRNQLIDARFQALYKINGRIENDKR